MPGRHFLIRLPAAISTPARGMGVGFQRVPFGGFAFISPVLVLNYIKCITYTVKSPTSPTCLSFKLFNVVRLHVLLIQLSLRHLRHVYHLNYSM